MHVCYQDTYSCMYMLWTNYIYLSHTPNIFPVQDFKDAECQGQANRHVVVTSLPPICIT